LVSAVAKTFEDRWTTSFIAGWYDPGWWATPLPYSTPKAKFAPFGRLREVLVEAAMAHPAGPLNYAHARGSFAREALDALDSLDGPLGNVRRRVNTATMSKPDPAFATGDATLAVSSPLNAYVASGPSTKIRDAHFNAIRNLLPAAKNHEPGILRLGQVAKAVGLAQRTLPAGTIERRG